MHCFRFASVCTYICHLHKSCATFNLSFSIAIARHICMYLCEKYTNRHPPINYNFYFIFGHFSFCLPPFSVPHTNIEQIKIRQQEKGKKIRFVHVSRTFAPCCVRHVSLVFRLHPFRSMAKRMPTKKNHNSFHCRAQCQQKLIIIRDIVVSFVCMCVHCLCSYYMPCNQSNCENPIGNCLHCKMGQRW